MSDHHHFTSEWVWKFLTAFCSSMFNPTFIYMQVSLCTASRLIFLKPHFYHVLGLRWSLLHSEKWGMDASLWPWCWSREVKEAKQWALWWSRFPERWKGLRHEWAVRLRKNKINWVGWSGVSKARAVVVIQEMKWRDGQRSTELWKPTWGVRTLITGATHNELQE